MARANHDTEDLMPTGRGASDIATIVTNTVDGKISYHLVCLTPLGKYIIKGFLNDPSIVPILNPKP